MFLIVNSQPNIKIQQPFKCSGRRDKSHFTQLGRVVIVSHLRYSTCCCCVKTEVPGWTQVLSYPGGRMQRKGEEEKNCEGDQWV